MVLHQNTAKYPPMLNLGVPSLKNSPLAYMIALIGGKELCFPREEAFQLRGCAEFRSVRHELHLDIVNLSYYAIFFFFFPLCVLTNLIKKKNNFSHTMDGKVRT